MGKLNQLLAVVAGKKKRALEVMTQAYHAAQKPELFGGLTRKYTPVDEEGERFPSESKRVQQTVAGLLEVVEPALVDMWDTVASVDQTNRTAVGDVAVEGHVLLNGAPVTTLLFLEKALVDLATFIGKLPVLDPTESWEADTNSNLYVTSPTETVKTKKVPRAFVKAEATKEHPAQVDVFTEDIVVGYWQATKFCGGITAKCRDDMLGRVRRLQEAVAKAREQANNTDVQACKIGNPILRYVFDGFTD